jgi:hypothetical protein
LHARAIEIEHVERCGGDAGQSLGLGDDLLSQLEGGDLVEDVGDREWRAADIGQLSGWAQVVLFV